MRLLLDEISELCTEQDIRRLFERYGRVIDVRIARSTVCKYVGYGFVEMENADDAQRAMAALNGISMKIRPLRVIMPPPR